ncbi:MAG TPA: aldo/keto reductase [Myxococcaceae bacterium]|nr:aldo/keto reductase [Myxococcaceae bacterium]
MSQDDRFSRRTLLKLGVGTAAGASLVEAPSALAAAADAGLPQVPRRRLGKTGRDVPILLMGGSMSFDQRFDPKLAECLRFGVNYFDTADCYAGGGSETAIGNFLERSKKRDSVWITTKSDRWDPDGLEATLRTSLERLKTDHVDMYFLHMLEDASRISAETAKVAERMKKEGRIQHFGFSCHSGNVVELMTLAAKTTWVDAIMFRYNFRQYGNRELNVAIDACAKANIGLIAMKTQGSEAGFADAWKKFEQTGRWTKHQAVLKAVWADPRISAAVSHMDNLEKLKQNIAAALDRSELGALDRQALERYAADTRSLACDGCDHHCNPAVAAPVQIGATLRCLMYHDVYGQPELARERFHALPTEAQRLAGVDFSGASRACPHGVDVVTLMDRASKVLV